MPIIEAMKGLNCYASFCVASGTKKSLTLTQAKDGFFVPGDIVDVQRKPFCSIAVAGHPEIPQPIYGPYFPATARFVILFSIQGGLQGV